jgi:hypothetical protein
LTIAAGTIIANAAPLRFLLVDRPRPAGSRGQVGTLLV